MRRLVLALSATTLIFAASTVYLARALHLERARAEADSREAAGAAPLTPAAESAARYTFPASGPPAGQAGSRALQAEAKSSPAEGRRASSEGVNVVSRASPDPSKQLAELTDPEQRAAMLEERKHSYRTFYPGLADHLHLDDAEFDRFTETIARQELEMQEAHLRCYIEKTCTPQSLSGLGLARQRELTDQFGAQTVEAFQYYQQTTGVRQVVSQMRATLPDKLRLMDAQSESLIGALHEESQRISSDAQRRDVRLSSFNSLIYTPEPDAPETGNEWQAANEYNRMLRDRAATVLTTEQLVVYEKMQQDAMRSYQEMRNSTRRQRPGSQAD